jgi:hypothetical protein
MWKFQISYGMEDLGEVSVSLWGGGRGGDFKF